MHCSGRLLTFQSVALRRSLLDFKGGFGFKKRLDIFFVLDLISVA